MDRKQSSFTQVSELEDSDFIPSFGMNTNKKISKADFFDQIKDETQIFIYPTIELLQAANLVADPDLPVYARVEETLYRLYKITSLAPGADDIPLNNGSTATFQEEYYVQVDTNAATEQEILDGLANNKIVTPLGASQTLLRTFNAVADAALASLPIGAKFSTKGCLSIGDGGHGDFIVEAASGTPDGYSRVLLANGNHGVLQPVNGAVTVEMFGGDVGAAIRYAKAAGLYIAATSDITVLIPTDTTAMQDAVDYINIPCSYKVTILIESGYEITSGLSVVDGYYSNFIISSVDPEIAVADGYTDGYIVKAQRAQAPVFGILIDGKHIVSTMIDVQHKSEITVLSGKGVRNPAYRGIYINIASRCYMNNAISTGATILPTSRNLWVTRNSMCECGASEFDGAGDYNVWVSRASVVYGEAVTFKNANHAAIGSTRHSIATFNLANISDCAAAARSFGGNIYLNDATATGLTVGGLYSQDTGRISARNMTLIADAGSGTLEYGILAEDASTVAATSAVIDGFRLVGVYTRSASTVNLNGATISNTSSGALIEVRDASTVSANGTTLSNAPFAIRLRNASRVSAVGAIISGITTNTLYSINGSVTDLSSAQIGVIASGNVSVYRGSTVIVELMKVGGVAVSAADTNLVALDTWYSRGVAYASTL